MAVARTCAASDVLLGRSGATSAGQMMGGPQSRTATATAVSWSATGSSTCDGMAIVVTWCLLPVALVWRSCFVAYLDDAPRMRPAGQSQHPRKLVVAWYLQVGD